MVERDGYSPSEIILHVDNSQWERKEIVYSFDEWAGGFFDTGGAFYFDTQYKRENQFVVPVISYTDNSASRLEALQQTLGGTINEASSKWTIRNLDAVDFAEKIRRFAPARQHQIDIFASIPNFTHSERVEIADLQRRSPRFKDVLVEDYYDLLTNPKFLAGIYDSRGSLLSTQDNEPVINISTQNKVVLDALRTRFGGWIVKEKKPPAKGIRKRQSVSSYRYGLKGNKAHSFFDNINDYLILRKDDITKIESFT